MSRKHEETNDAENEEFTNERTQMSKLEAHVNRLKQDITRLCQEIVRMKEVENQLIGTSKRDISRKDRLIADLRRQLDDVDFRPCKNCGFNQRNASQNQQEANFSRSNVERSNGLRDPRNKKCELTVINYNMADKFPTSKRIADRNVCTIRSPTRTDTEKTYDEHETHFRNCSLTDTLTENDRLKIAKTNNLTPKLRPRSVSENNTHKMKNANRIKQLKSKEHEDMLKRCGLNDLSDDDDEDKRDKKDYEEQEESYYRFRNMNWDRRNSRYDEQRPWFKSEYSCRGKLHKSNSHNRRSRIEQNDYMFERKSRDRHRYYEDIRRGGKFVDRRNMDTGPRENRKRVSRRSISVQRSPKRRRYSKSPSELRSRRRSHSPKKSEPHVSPLDEETNAEDYKLELETVRLKIAALKEDREKNLSGREYSSDEERMKEEQLKILENLQDECLDKIAETEGTGNKEVSKTVPVKGNKKPRKKKVVHALKDDMVAKLSVESIEKLDSETIEKLNSMAAKKSKRIDTDSRLSRNESDAEGASSKTALMKTSSSGSDQHKEEPFQPSSKSKECNEKGNSKPEEIATPSKDSVTSSQEGSTDFESPSKRFEISEDKSKRVYENGDENNFSLSLFERSDGDSEKETGQAHTISQVKKLFDRVDIVHQSKVVESAHYNFQSKEIIINSRANLLLYSKAIDQTATSNSTKKSQLESSNKGAQASTDSLSDLSGNGLEELQNRDNNVKTHEHPNKNMDASSVERGFSKFKDSSKESDTVQLTTDELRAIEKTQIEKGSCALNKQNNCEVNEEGKTSEVCVKANELGKHQDGIVTSTQVETDGTDKENNDLVQKELGSKEPAILASKPMSRKRRRKMIHCSTVIDYGDGIEETITIKKENTKTVVESNEIMLKKSKEDVDKLQNKISLCTKQRITDEGKSRCCLSDSGEEEKVLQAEKNFGENTVMPEIDRKNSFQQRKIESNIIDSNAEEKGGGEIKTGGVENSKSSSNSIQSKLKDQNEDEEKLRSIPNSHSDQCIVASSNVQKTLSVSDTGEEENKISLETATSSASNAVDNISNSRLLLEDENAMTNETELSSNKQLSSTAVDKHEIQNVMVQQKNAESSISATNDVKSQSNTKARRKSCSRRIIQPSTFVDTNEISNVSDTALNKAENSEKESVKDVDLTDSPDRLVIDLSTKPSKRRRIQSTCTTDSTRNNVEYEKNDDADEKSDTNCDNEKEDDVQRRKPAIDDTATLNKQSEDPEEDIVIVGRRRRSKLGRSRRSAKVDSQPEAETQDPTGSGRNALSEIPRRRLSTIVESNLEASKNETTHSFPKVNCKSIVISDVVNSVEVDKISNPNTFVSSQSVLETHKGEPAVEIIDKLECLMGKTAEIGLEGMEKAALVDDVGDEQNLEYAFEKPNSPTVEQLDNKDEHLAEIEESGGELVLIASICENVGSSSDNFELISERPKGDETENAPIVEQFVEDTGNLILKNKTSSNGNFCNSTNSIQSEKTNEIINAIFGDDSNSNNNQEAPETNIADPMIQDTIEAEFMQMFGDSPAPESHEDQLDSPVTKSINEQIEKRNIYEPENLQMYLEINSEAVRSIMEEHVKALPDLARGNESSAELNAGIGGDTFDDETFKAIKSITDGLRVSPKTQVGPQESVMDQAALLKWNNSPIKLYHSIFATSEAPTRKSTLPKDEKQKKQPRKRKLSSKSKAASKDEGSASNEIDAGVLPKKPKRSRKPRTVKAKVDNVNDTGITDIGLTKEDLTTKLAEVKRSKPTVTCLSKDNVTFAKPEIEQEINSACNNENAPDCVQAKAISSKPRSALKLKKIFDAKNQNAPASFLTQSIQSSSVQTDSDENRLALNDKDSPAKNEAGILKQKLRVSFEDETAPTDSKVSSTNIGNEAALPKSTNSGQTEPSLLPSSITVNKYGLFTSQTLKSNYVQNTSRPKVCTPSLHKSQCAGSSTKTLLNSTKLKKEAVAISSKMSKLSIVESNNDRADFPPKATAACTITFDQLASSTHTASETETFPPLALISDDWLEPMQAKNTVRWRKPKLTAVDPEDGTLFACSSQIGDSVLPQISTLGKHKNQISKVAHVEPENPVMPDSVSASDHLPELVLEDTAARAKTNKLTVLESEDRSAASLPKTTIAAGGALVVSELPLATTISGTVSKKVPNSDKSKPPANKASKLKGTHPKTRKTTTRESESTNSERLTEIESAEIERFVCDSLFEPLVIIDAEDEVNACAEIPSECALVSTKAKNTCRNTNVKNKTKVLPKVNSSALPPEVLGNNELFRIWLEARNEKVSTLSVSIPENESAAVIQKINTSLEQIDNATFSNKQGTSIIPSAIITGESGMSDAENSNGSENIVKASKQIVSRRRKSVHALASMQDELVAKLIPSLERADNATQATSILPSATITNGDGTSIEENSSGSGTVVKAAKQKVSRRRKSVHPLAITEDVPVPKLNPSLEQTDNATSLNTLATSVLTSATITDAGGNSNGVENKIKTTKQKVTRRRKGEHPLAITADVPVATKNKTNSKSVKPLDSMETANKPQTRQRKIVNRRKSACPVRGADGFLRPDPFRPVNIGKATKQKVIKPSEDTLASMLASASTALWGGMLSPIPERNTAVPRYMDLLESNAGSAKVAVEIPENVCTNNEENPTQNRRSARLFNDLGKAATDERAPEHTSTQFTTATLLPEAIVNNPPEVVKQRRTRRENLGVQITD